MRVALVYHDFNLERSLARERVLLARGLAAEGVEVHCYSNPETRGAEAAGVVFHDVRPARRSSGRVGHAVECGTFAWKATALLREHRTRYDVIDVAGTSAWEHDVVRAQAVPLSEQRRWPERGGRSFRAARARARAAHVLHPALGVARATQTLQLKPGNYLRVVAVTEEVSHDLQRVHGVPEQVIRVVAPPIELPDPAGSPPFELRRRLGLGVRDQLVLFVGHDFERKGLGDAIEAVAAASPAAHLAVVGGGDEPPFRAAADRLGVGNRVHFLGVTSEPNRFFPEADVFLLPTREDVWGTTVIEAMAAGVPVVVTAAAGAAAEIRRTGAGLVVENGSPAGLTDTLVSLLEAPGRRREMAERGREAAYRHGEAEHARVIYQIYAGVIEEGAQGRRS
jgi:UDP-glucose:(heptosyl)LPS alpha-1,3-glucosyltransferase